MKNRTSLVLLPVGILVLLGLLVLLERDPGLFANTNYLGAILALQIALVGLSHFEEVFFPLLMGTFLWAGSSLPLAGTAMSLRWLFLAVGALGGFVLWIKSPRTRHFGAFHLVALFCVVSALVSALVSETPKIAFLKVLSLFMLFLYTSAGARIAIAGREAKFMSGLILTCEVLVYLSSASYFVLGFGVFGNPNALGAVIGVVAVPVLLWAALIADTRGLRQRRFLALALCGGLLYLSNSRASILGAMIVVLVFTVALRHQRLLLQFAFVSFFFVTLMAVINPSHMDDLFSSFTGRVIYKEQGTHHGLFGSRMSPWFDTISVVKRHPWFGSGFGTSELGELRPEVDSSSVYTTEGTNREHGNSYLALTEYMGLLGVAPFVLLLLLLVRVVIRTFGWMRRTGNAYHYCIPFTLIVIAGLVHACFEDWLFAVGSYLSLFFWVSAFILGDLAPEARAEVRTQAANTFAPYVQPAR
ncbi:MAG: O-antigen ligase family protein [Candidatus Sulfotelmatobacter sp.]